MSSNLRQTDRTTMSRHRERGSYDREIAYAILDEGLVAHVGLTTGRGVMVVPMTYARCGDQLVLHGAVASHWVSSFVDGKPVSVCVTLLDEASVKIRSGPPKDAARDDGSPHWPGVIPLDLAAGEALPDDPTLCSGQTTPGYARGYSRRRAT